MASRQVKKLCKKILEETGVWCDPESFCRERTGVEFGAYPWSMDVDMYKSPAFTEVMKRDDMVGDMFREDTFTCFGTSYMKDCLGDDIKLTKWVIGFLGNSDPQEREIIIYTNGER